METNNQRMKIMYQIVNILVIDDHKETRTTLSSILTNEGYLVELAENGKEAIKISKKTKFDLALIDIQLPDIKGTELLSKLKEIQPKMGTIIVTGHPSIENAIKSVNNKADGYVLKPIDMALLLETIKKILSDKTNAYLRMFAEVEQSKSSSPVFKYQTPERW